MDFITNLIPSFGNIAFTLLFFVIALSIIVAIHEYGHYIVGRWSGIHAEVFSIGFGKVLWSRRDKRGTLWQIAALPFGGYVKFLGDANAASVGGRDAADGGAKLDDYIEDRSALSAEAVAHTEALTERNTMLGAPLWARSATVAAGPIFNFIFSAIVFAGVLFFQGQPLTPLTVSEVPKFPENIRQELRPGDQIISVNGIDLNYPEGLNAAFSDLPSQPDVEYGVERDGEFEVIHGPQPQPALVQAITPRSAADDAGLRIHDVIVSMDGTPVYKFDDMIEFVDANGANPISLEVWRGGDTLNIEMTPRLLALPQEDGTLRDELKLGIGGAVLFFEPETEGVGFFDSIRIGARQVWVTIKTSLGALKSMVVGELSTCNLNGPIGIAETSGSMARQGTQSFILLIAGLSTAVGLLNLFPIPILDGGHLVFHAYEAVTGKMPSDGALRILMALGIALIGTLMLFAIGNDLLFCP